MKPDFADAMRDKQEHVKEQCDERHGAERVFCVGDRVSMKTVCGEHVSWQEAVVSQVVSAVTHVLKVHNQFRFVHADHLRSSHADASTRACDMERPEQCDRPERSRGLPSLWCLQAWTTRPQHSRYRFHISQTENQVTMPQSKSQPSGGPGTSREDVTSHYSDWFA